jgi:uncharacterized protein YggT (Ycf19 family)
MDVLFNLLCFLFWLRLWEDRYPVAAPNVYLAPMDRLGRAMLDYAQPAFGRLSRPAAALVAGAFVLAIRALAIGPATTWRLRFGIVPPAAPQALVEGFLFSLLSFAVFLFNLWGVALLFAGSHGRTRSGGYAPDALYRLTRPLSMAPAHLRPLGLLALGAAIAALTPRMGGTPPNAALLRSLAGWLIESAAAWADLLPVIQTILVALVIGSWAAVALNIPLLGYACREWLDLLLGPLRRLPLRAGGFDLTPVAAAILIAILHPVLMDLLLRLYRSAAAPPWP